MLLTFKELYKGGSTDIIKISHLMHVVYFLLTRFQMDFMWLKLFCLQVSKKKKKKKKKINKYKNNKIKQINFQFATPFYLQPYQGVGMGSLREHFFGQ